MRLSSRHVLVTGMQARIQLLQVTLASDSSQHASAYSQLQQQHEQLQHECESATHKGNHPFAHPYIETSQLQTLSRRSKTRPVIPLHGS